MRWLKRLASFFKPKKDELEKLTNLISKLRSERNAVRLETGGAAIVRVPNRGANCRTRRRARRAC